MVLAVRAWIILAIGFAAPAMARTEVQQDRLDPVGRYPVTAPVCGKPGMRLDPDLPARAEAALKAKVH